MLHRIVLATFGMLTLATCQNQQTTKSTSEKTETATPKTTTGPVSTPTKTGEQEMAPGMPPDKEAIEQAKREAAAMEAQKKATVYLAEGENTFLKEQQMNVTFKQITEDSRCPKDVNCIWEGAATAEVEFMGTYTRPQTLRLSTMNDANKGLAKTQNFNGYNVTLVSLTPETTSDKGYKQLKGKYKIGLKFEKAAATPATKGGTTTK